MTNYPTSSKGQELWAFACLIGLVACGIAVDGANSTKALGEACESDDQCASSTCEQFYIDQDEDGYSPSLAAEWLCSNTSFSPALKTLREPTSVATSDCADDDARVHPGQVEFFDDPISSRDPSDRSAFDYNCDGVAEYIHQDATERSRAPGGAATCGFTPFALCGVPHWTDPEVVVCGQLGFREVCGQVFPNTPPFENLGCATGDIVGQIVACR